MHTAVVFAQGRQVKTVRKRSWRRATSGHVARMKIHFIHLRELFYDRNPGDARVKVGSERKVASSPTSVSARSGVRIWEFVRGGPPKLALLWGNLLP